MAANVKSSGSEDILTHMSPRLQLGLDLKVYTVVDTADEVPTDASRRFFSSQNYVLAVDTKRDKLAGIGRSWEAPPLKLGQTWISSRLAKMLDLKVNDLLDVELNVYDLLSRYVTLNDELTSFFTTQEGSPSPGINPVTNRTIKGNRTKCLEETEKNMRPTPRSNDVVLIGTHSVVCNPGSRQTLFCGAVSDGSRCGMSNKAMVRLQVADVVEDWEGRLPSGGDDESEDGGGGAGKPSSMVVVEVEHVMQLVMRAMPKEVADLLEPVVASRLGGGVGGSEAEAAKARSASLSALSFDSVSEIFVNLPKLVCNRIWLNDDYVSIQEGVVEYSGRVINSIGAIWLQVQNPILVYLRRQRFTTLYLGMVMDILIAILLGLSSVLIYRCVSHFSLIEPFDNLFQIEASSCFAMETDVSFYVLLAILFFQSLND
jgi:hypothetical protein